MTIGILILVLSY